MFETSIKDEFSHSKKLLIKRLEIDPRINNARTASHTRCMRAYAFIDTLKFST